MKNIRVENLDLEIVKNLEHYLVCKIQGDENVNFKGFTIKPRHLIIICKHDIEKIDSIFTFAVWIEDNTANTYTYFEFNENGFEEDSICWTYSGYWELLDDLYKEEINK